MKLALVAGTRPEIIKLAPLAKALEQEKLPFSWVLVRQHKELLALAKESFSIDGYEIPIKQGSLATRLGSAVSKLESALQPFTHVVVQGDTLSTLAGALAGFFSKKPIIHVEAGLRSGNISEPWPEEMIRILVDRLATLRFAPTPTNAENLQREGLDSICTLGNTISDALAMTRIPRIIRPFPEYFLVALLRRENWEIIPKVYGMLSEKKDWNFAVVVHPNHERAKRFLRGSHIRVLDPLHYRVFLALLRNAKAVITDSGGTQEEASLLGVPAFILRRAIDRPESIRAGQAKQVPDFLKLFEVIEGSDLEAMARPEKIYGDGKVSKRIVAELKANLPELKGL